MFCGFTRLFRRSGERGGVIAETALVTPVLVLILCYLIQGIYLSQAYLSISHIAREATLSASSVKNASANAQSNMNPSEGEVKTCLEAPAPDPSCAHKVAHWRIRRLLESNKLAVGDFSFVTRRSTVGESRGMQIEIQGSPRVVAPMLSTTVLKADVHAEYIAQ